MIVMMMVVVMILRQGCTVKPYQSVDHGDQRDGDANGERKVNTG